MTRDCRQNKPAYQTFKMQRVFDVDSATDDIRWTTLRNKIDSINVNLTNLVILTPRLHEQLIQLANGLSVNFTAHRSQVCIQFNLDKENTPSLLWYVM